LGDYQIRFIVGGNEESGSLGVEYYFNTLKKKQPTFGFSPDAEFPLIYAEKGIYTFKAGGEVYLPEVISIKAGLAANSVIEECVLTLDKDSKFAEFLKDNTSFPYLSENKDDVLVVTIKGVSAHGATPSLGKNAGVEALRLLALYLNDQKLIELFNKFLDLEGRGLNAYCYSDNMECGSSMNVGIIEYENSNLNLVINYRYVDTCDINKTKENIALAISPLKIITGGDSHLLFYEKTSTLVKTLLESYQEETGDYISKPMAIGGGTYAKEANNIIAFGSEFPGWNSNMHSIGESVKKSDLFKAASVYLRATLALGRKIDENKI
jgi:succinyl-diaminopimelate desuccinylase